MELFPYPYNSRGRARDPMGFALLRTLFSDRTPMIALTNMDRGGGAKGDIK
jgi:hypothetical protein